MKRIQAVITFLILSVITYSQNIDSLKTVLKNAKHDTVRVKALVDLSDACDLNEIEDYASEAMSICNTFLKTCPPNHSLKPFYLKQLAAAINNLGFLAQESGEIPNAIEYYSRSLKIRQQIGDKPGMASTLNNMAFIYEQQGEIQKALDIYNKSLKISESIDDKFTTANLLNNIGYLCNQQGDIPRALEYHSRSMKIRETLGDDYGMANSMNNLGAIYKNQGDLKKAQEYFEKSLVIRKQMGDKQGIATSLNNLGSISDIMGDKKKALEYYKDGLAIREEAGEAKGIGSSLNNIGALLADMGNLDEALEYFNRSLKIRNEIGDKQGMANSLNCIAGVLMKKGDWLKSKVNAEHSLLLSKELGYPENIKRASFNLGAIYAHTGNYKKAYEMQVLFKQMSDSITNEANKKASVQKVFQYEYEKKAAADSIRTVEERKVHAAKLKAEETQRYALYAGLILIAAFSVFVFNRFRVTQKQKAIIESQKHEVDRAYEKLHEKNKEVLDSIHYAKRIQNSLLTNVKYIGRELNRLSKSNSN